MGHFTRRKFIVGVAAAAGVGGSTGCRQSSPPAAPAGAAAPGANAKYALSIGCTGLCVFQRRPNTFRIALLEATDIEGPDKEKFYAHNPILLVDAKATSGGEVISGSKLAELRLPTALTEFRAWPLIGINVIFNNLNAGRTKASLAGTVPVRAMTALGFKGAGTLPTNWYDAKFVNSFIEISGGQFVSTAPRPNSEGYELAMWKLAGTAAANKADWDKIVDVPRALSDVAVFTDVLSAVPSISLVKRSDKSKVADITLSGDAIETWIVNDRPSGKHTQYEMKRAYELQHARAFYQLFQEFAMFDLKECRVPIADPADYADTDPIFCPPGEL